MAEGQPSNSHPQIFGNCIGCKGLIRVSTQTDVNAKIRCPHCKQVFSVVEILDQSAPMVEVVGDAEGKSVVAHIDRVLQSTDEEKVSADSFVVPPQLAKGARRRGRRSSSGRSKRRSSSRGESRESSQESSRDGRSETWRRSTSEPETGSPIDVIDRGDAKGSTGSDDQSHDQSHDRGQATQPRPSRRSAAESHRHSRPSRGAMKAQQDFERNSGLEVAKVLLGAMLALPIAYMLVIWVFGQDPLGVGKSMGGTVPFLVPAEFRAGAVDTSDKESKNPSIKKEEKEVFEIDPKFPGDDLFPNIDTEALDRIGE